MASVQGCAAGLGVSHVVELLYFRSRERAVVDADVVDGAGEIVGRGRGPVCSYPPWPIRQRTETCIIGKCYSNLAAIDKDLHASDSLTAVVGGDQMVPHTKTNLSL